MKFYRLAEPHPRYGVSGHVIPHDGYLAVRYNDRALYDRVDEFGTGYAYKCELARGSTPSLYYLETYADVVMLIETAIQTLKDRRVVKPVLPIATSGTLLIGNEYILNIIYRSQWDSTLNT